MLAEAIPYLARAHFVPPREALAHFGVQLLLHGTCESVHHRVQCFHFRRCAVHAFPSGSAAARLDKLINGDPAHLKELWIDDAQPLFSHQQAAHNNGKFLLKFFPDNDLSYSLTTTLLSPSYQLPSDLPLEGPVCFRGVIQAFVSSDNDTL